MENTGNVLFGGETAPQWYIALGEKWVGPLTAADVYQKVLAQEITWAHFVWKPGQADWKRICDLKVFQAAVPNLPGKGVQSAVETAAATPVIKKAPASRVSGLAPPPSTDAISSQLREWFLYINESQAGPFSTEEVTRFLAVGKVSEKAHGWRDGMGDWTELQKTEEFARFQKKMPTPPAAPKKSEKRRAPRKPLVARLLLANDESVDVGVCRDVSVGGMQILTGTPPGPVGTRIKMNVSPPGDKKSNGFAPFVAEGVIVRILDDGHGFSFRFEKLSAASKQAIEKYIAGQGPSSHE